MLAGAVWGGGKLGELDADASASDAAPIAVVCRTYRVFFNVESGLLATGLRLLLSQLHEVQCSLARPCPVPSQCTRVSPRQAIHTDAHLALDPTTEISLAVLLKQALLLRT